MPLTLMFAGFFTAPRVGLEPTTLRLTAECSAIELSRKKEENKNIHPQNPIRKEKEGNKEKAAIPTRPKLRP